MATEFNNNCGSYHNLDCQSNLAEGEYDSACVRCTKIRQVVALRRKTTKNGASDAESHAASQIALRLIASFGLTRGEVYDRIYNPVIAQVQAQTTATKQGQSYKPARRGKMGSNSARYATKWQKMQKEDDFI
jgi:hypothetical protein